MKKLSMKEIMLVASMLFGMFFGAGNLIFPASMGQLAGSHMWQASAGFLITGVGLPLLGVAALGISRQNGLLELSSRVGKRYGLFLPVSYISPSDRFCDPAMCHGFLYRRDRGDRPGADHTFGLAVFSLLFLHWSCSFP